MVIALLCSAFSLFAAAFELRRSLPSGAMPSHTWAAVALAGVVLAWLATHTAYTLRYAHLYYRHGDVGGLIFPGGGQPRDSDFAYFAFTIGVCMQTADVSIDAWQVRRVVLVHALLSFVYNTTVLALAINLLIGLAY